MIKQLKKAKDLGETLGPKDTIQQKEPKEINLQAPSALNEISLHQNSICFKIRFFHRKC